MPNTRLLLTIAPIALLAAEVQAQTQPSAATSSTSSAEQTSRSGTSGTVGTSSDVVRAADDAFGRRVGIESVGLYSENEVRGFNLQTAGNYRLDGHYFVPTGALPVAASGSTTIRVGANGLRTDFTAPSGVVQYETPRDDRANGGTLEAGWWAGSGPALVGTAAVRDASGTISFAGGAQFNPAQRYTDGSEGVFKGAGGVVRVRPSSNVLVAVLATADDFRRGPNTAFASESKAPPTLRRNYFRGQTWAAANTSSQNYGGYSEIDLGEGFRFDASVLVTASQSRGDVFNLLTIKPTAAKPRGGSNTVVLLPSSSNRNVAGEIKLEKSFGNADVAHRLVAIARQRDSRATTGVGTTLASRAFDDADDFTSYPDPGVGNPVSTGLDAIRQSSFGLGYRVSFASTLELRADAQHQTYRKRVQTGATTREQTTRSWLGSAAATLALGSRSTGFASFARGLEEAGVAPGNATNRGDVLPAAIGRQIEIGVKHAIPNGPTLIGGAFEIVKQLPGLDETGRFSYVGRLTSRGVEFSLSGRITPRLNAVLGAYYIDAKVSGSQVDQGLVGSRPVGRPRFLGIASMTWRVPWADGLGLDANLAVRGPRAADVKNTFNLPTIATVAVGARQTFKIDDVNFTARLRVSNLLNLNAWNVGGSGLFAPLSPRTATLSVTATL